jgi:hypothetical protein
MSDLQARLDALPEWRANPDHRLSLLESVEQLIGERDWALIRLALAHELAWAGDVRLVAHTDSCRSQLDGPDTCDCGRDALLKAMEVPK